MALVVAACTAAGVLAHRAMSDTQAPAAAILVASVPLVIILATLARRIGAAIVLAIAALLAACAWWLGLAGLERHAADLFFVEHAGTMLALAIVFGRTLGPGREPLCSRFARMVHGTIDAATALYTRRLTATWTAFFVIVCAASCLLYATHRLEEWSLLASVLTPALVVLLFVAEYAVRGYALPHNERVGILAAVHAFRRHMAGSRAPR
jgi:uncharacterized membrane protein